MALKHNILGQYTVSLINCVINNSIPEEMPSDIDISELYRFCNMHNVSVMAYYALKKLYSDTDILTKFEEDYKKYTLREARQQIMTEMLFDRFEKAGIRCLPLKGFVIKRFYPVESMRYSVDVDILFDENKRDELDKIMLDLGFEHHSEEYDQIIYMKKPIYNYEMHLSAIEKKLDGAEYFDSVWERAVRLDNKEYCFEMSLTDLYIHTIKHFHKHYTGEGAGIKFILDIFLLKRQLTDDEHKKAYEVLHSFGLYDFCKIMENLSEIWFSSAENMDERYTVISEFLYRNGAFGDGSVGVITKAEKDGDTKKSFFNKILSYLKWWFLGIDDMKGFYPILNKAPFLLPFCWVHKGVKTLIFKPQAIKREIKKVKSSKTVNEVFKLSGL